jgi:peptide/nickel transport system substrate-binding protein
MPEPRSTRRRFLQRGAAFGTLALSRSTRVARAADEQAPRRGGILTIRAWDPPSFDVQQLSSYKTQIIYSFTHSRLLKHRTGPTVAPGFFPIEGDLAESWSQPSDTIYEFRLRRGVRWHNRHPLHGRELTAEDVKFTVGRFLSEPGNASQPALASVDRVEVVNRYTVRFVLRSPFTWLLDVLASPGLLPIIAKECVEEFGDLKRPEAVVGTGPWMLDTYRRNVGMTLTRHPGYFLPGLPYIEQVRLVIDDDSARVLAAFLTGQYDLGVDPPGIMTRSDWLQIRDRLPGRRPHLRTIDLPDTTMFVILMRTDRYPFTDVRVRRAIALAVDRREIIRSVMEGVGALNAPVPAALKEWSLPVEQLGDGAHYYDFSPEEARRLLAQAGIPQGFQTTMIFSGAYGRGYLDTLQLVARNLRDVGVDVKLVGKEYGAFVSTAPLGRFESMALSAFPPAGNPFVPLFSRYHPGEVSNAGHVNDPTLTSLLHTLEAERDPIKRRAEIHAFQRHAAALQYYIHLPSATNVAAWDPALKNYWPNSSYDYGGRLLASWLDR